jgi:chaperonin cofactor prefoldin
VADRGRGGYPAVSGEAVTDDEIKTWVARLVERAKLETEIDVCQAGIESLKVRLQKLQDELRALEF